MLPEEQQALHRIRRYRLAFWICLLGYIPVFWIVARRARSDWALAVVTIVWAVAVVRIAARIAFSHCPRCGNYFHATTGTPSFWNLLARICTHCGLPLRPTRVVYPSME